MATTSAQPTRAAAPTSGADAPQTTVQLLRRLLDELSTLFRQELRLALAEISRSVSQLLLGVSSIAVAGAVLFASLLLLLAAAVLALAQALPAWLAAAIVGSAAALAGYLLLRAGRSRFTATALKPEHSAESLRRDKDVLMRRAP